MNVRKIRSGARPHPDPGGGGRCSAPPLTRAVRILGRRRPDGKPRRPPARTHGRAFCDLSASRRSSWKRLGVPPHPSKAEHAPSFARAARRRRGHRLRLSRTRPPAAGIRLRGRLRSGGAAGGQGWRAGSAGARRPRGAPLSD